MSMQWECIECGGITSRAIRPRQCRQCNAGQSALVRIEENDDPHGAESQYETWVRHGMRTTRHWRSHAA